LIFAAVHGLRDGPTSVEGPGAAPLPQWGSRGLAPIAAVTFTVEEIIGDIDHTMLSGVVVAAALAAVIEHSVLGTHPVFSVPTEYGLTHASSLLVYTLLGVTAAFVGNAFSGALLGSRGWFGRLAVPVWSKPAIGGLITGLLAVVAFLAIGARGITGGGYATLSAALTGNLGWKVLLGVGVLKFLATAASYGSGGAGGIFAPTLFIGGMLGGCLGIFDQEILGNYDNQIGGFALVGMGAVMAAVVRTPITSVLIIFEMTHSLTDHQSLMDAVARMHSVGARQMLVVDQDAPERLVGMLAMSDVVRAHARAAHATTDDDVDAVDANERRSAVTWRTHETLVGERIERVSTAGSTPTPAPSTTTPRPATPKPE